MVYIGDISSWIVGLMAENYDAVGFIPEPTVRCRYLAHHRYILQEDDRGRPVGYLLHGALERGRPCVISQHLIDYDYRRRHYGMMAFKTFVERCEFAGASSIHLRVADDLPALQFWQSCGFRIQRTVSGGEARNRVIVEMYYLLRLPMFEFFTKGSRP
jgi:hypothetical protein